MKNEPLVIKKRGEDGSRVITVRLKEDILAALDQLAADSNYSRNELINIILRHGIENIKIEWEWAPTLFSLLLERLYFFLKCLSEILFYNLLNLLGKNIKSVFLSPFGW